MCCVAVTQSQWCCSETFSWAAVPTQLAPLPRKQHTATLLATGPGGSDTVFLFGGTTSSHGEPLNDLYRLDVGKATLCVDKGFGVTLTWRCCSLAATIGTYKSMWRKAKVKGPAPSKRFGHTATAIGSTKLLVFGGASSGTTFLNDLHMLHMGKKPSMSVLIGVTSTSHHLMKWTRVYR